MNTTKDNNTKATQKSEKSKKKSRIKAHKSLAKVQQSECKKDDHFYSDKS